MNADISQEAAEIQVTIHLYMLMNELLREIFHDFLIYYC